MGDETHPENTDTAAVRGLIFIAGSTPDFAAI